MQKNSMDFSKYNFQPDDFKFYQKDDILTDRVPENDPVGFFKDAMIRYSKNKAALVSTVIIGFIIVMAIFAPMFSQYTYKEQNVTWDALPPRIQYIEKLGIFDGTGVLGVPLANIETRYKDSFIKIIDEYTVVANKREVKMAHIKVNMYVYKAAGDKYFWFGTDALGRDSWVRLWRGARISLLMSFMAVALNLIIGVLFGSISGYYGGWIDLVLQRIVEVLSSMPTVPLLILFIVTFGTGLVPIVVALCLTGWISMSIMVRAQFYRYKNYDYVMASRTMGAGDWRLILRHILPNAIGPTITQVTMAIPTFIKLESYLAYLGIGVSPPESSVGILLSDGQKMLLDYPHLTLFPALVISILMLSFNLVNNGLRDSFDPSMRGQ